MNLIKSRLLSFCRAESGVIGTGQIITLIMSILVIVIGVIMAPLVFDQTGFARGNSNIDNFAGVQAIVDLIPLLYAVGVLALAGGLAFAAIKGGGNK